jgi:hypothetical protein
MDGLNENAERGLTSAQVVAIDALLAPIAGVPGWKLSGLTLDVMSGVATAFFDDAFVTVMPDGRIFVGHQTFTTAELMDSVRGQCAQIAHLSSQIEAAVGDLFRQVQDVKEQDSLTPS